MKTYTDKTFYTKLVSFLGTALGPRYEVVYHVISKRGTYIAAIHNNHISGRTLDSPLTAFANQLIQDKVYLYKDFVHGYKALIADKKTVLGSTFFIKDKNGELTGLLCINYDNTEMQKVLGDLIHLENLQSIFTSHSSLNKNDLDLSKERTEQDFILENLSQSVDELVEEIIGIHDEKYTFNSEQKEKYIKQLYLNGIFNIKGSISSVSRILNMSEPSVYRYLQKIKNHLRNKVQV